MTVLTIRDVPEDIRDNLAREAREQGQSLQAFLLGMIKQWATFNRNLEIIAEVERDLATGGGGGPDAPDAADLIREARAERVANLNRGLGDDLRGGA